MCIVLVKKRGVSLPDNFKSIIKACFLTNSDGAGFMLKRPGSNNIYMEKGLMKIDDLLFALKKADIDYRDELAVHFRIGTSGGKGREMTHPFVVDKLESRVLMMHGTVEQPVMMHNGIFHGLPDTRMGSYSDTFYFAKDILGKYNPKAGRRTMNKWRKRFKKILASNKIAVMFPEKDHDIELLGRYYYKHKLFFSNTGFEYALKGFEREEKDDDLSNACVNAYYRADCMGSE